jgi:hypothetical protein
MLMSCKGAAREYQDILADQGREERKHISAVRYAGMEE